MRIALAYPGCHKKGGIERIMLEAANFFQKQGHEVHVLASEIDRNEFDPGIVLHHISTFPIPYISRFFLFSKEVVKEVKRSVAPDAILTFGVMINLSSVVSVQSVHRAWLETSLRNRNIFGCIKQWINPAHYFILGMGNTLYGGRKYSKLIACGNQVKVDLMRYYNIPADDIVIIPNGFSPHEFNTEKRSELRGPMRQKLGYSAADKVILFAANELDRKGFEQLVKAIASINHADIRLIVAGRSGPGHYGVLLKKLNISNRIRFAGRVNDIAPYYAAADIFALPTQYDPCPLVVIEALASGLPVLTSRLAGSSIAVAEGKTGELLNNPWDISEIASKLKLLLQGNHIPAEEISKSVESFNWHNIFSQYEKILNETRNTQS